MKTTLQFLLWMLLATSLAFTPGCGSDDDPTGPGTPKGPTVLVLGDGGSETHVIQNLKAAGLDVRDGGLFHEFDGTGLEGVDAVVLLAGVDYNHDMNDAGEAALVAFVTAGGGLVTTEWLNYSISRSNYHQYLRTILPVTYGGSYASGSETYSVMQAHPVTDGLPATFATSNGQQYSVLAPRSGASQLVRGNRSGAAVIAWTQGGRVVSLNMAGEYGQTDVWNANMDKLVANAARYAAGWGADPAN